MSPESTAILLPCFNDWDSLSLLLPELDRSLAEAGYRVSVLVVDDASTEPPPPDWLRRERFQAIHQVEVLRMRSNLGHQRAIALGLYHLHERIKVQTVVVMDGDGEDRPGDVPALLDEYVAAGGKQVVFAERTKRMEGVAFRLFYGIYRSVHRALTGVEVKVGNFSVAPRSAVTALMGVPELWNHYAASVYRARIPKRLVPTPRGRRLAGESRMNFVSLMMHGLSAMSVFSDQVSARLLAVAALFSTLTLMAMGATVAVRLFTAMAIPGWASTIVAMLAGLVVQSITFTVLFVFLIAHRRNTLGFLPLRDARHFILSCQTLWSSGQPLVDSAGDLSVLLDVVVSSLDAEAVPETSGERLRGE